VATTLKRVREETPVVVRPDPPVTLLLRLDALRSIGTAVGLVPTETGGPLVGTLQRSWEVGGERLIASILATVPPGPTMRAAWSSVSLGDLGDGERAASAVRWWRSVTGLDLRHLGDWHKHPSGAPEPSSGDRATGRRMKSESGSMVWLTGIAVGGRRRSEHAESEGHVIRLSRAWDAIDEIRFYREGPSGLVRVPVRVERAAIPRLPELPWHVMDPVRFAAECRMLQAAGLRIEIEPGRPDGRGLAVRLSQDSRAPITLMTGERYPVQAPMAFDQHGRRVWFRLAWSPARFLVDVAKEMG
jgi:hypothetical protein